MSEQKPATLDEVWNLFRETDRKFQETDLKFKETDLKFKETDRKFQETDQKFQETDRQIGKLGHRFGDLIEHLVAPNLLSKFETFGYQFTRISWNHQVKNVNKERLAEIDLLLENGEVAMVVEVKSLFTKADVKEHLKRMHTLRRYADEHQDKRKYAGAIAAALFDRDAKEQALESGFYVIAQIGDTVNIEVPEGFKPKLW
ncbi:MAG: hypothetical protein LBT14_07550 [Treponema sp.]|jgi:hypothetical protein|nr:hypothetical protein [Treponema sp.]